MTRMRPISRSGPFEWVGCIDAEIDSDRNAQRIAAIGAYSVEHERGKDEQQTGTRSDGLGAARGKAPLSGELEHWRVHHRRSAPRVHHFEFAAQFRVVKAPPTGDDIPSRPEDAGMVMTGVGGGGLMA